MSLMASARAKSRRIRQQGAERGAKRRDLCSDQDCKGSWNVTQIDNTIRFTVGESSLGRVLVAMSGKGVRAISFGNDSETLIRELQRQCFDAEPVADDAGLKPILAEVVAFVEDPARGLDLPLDASGTPFQQCVWQALREIPAGSRASYGQIARQIGAPKEAYAVGEACAANMIAVAIPCHRVVRKNGALAGYRWGFRCKRALLDREAHA